jgi:tight adherence protein B
MPFPRLGRRARAWPVALMTAALTMALPSAAYAADGSIDHVAAKQSKVSILYSVPGAGTVSPALDSIRVTLGGTNLEATARPASQTTVKRTTVLAIDVSDSMAGAKFGAAKRAASVFLRSVPEDVRVGIVTFAGSVHAVQRPSLDRAASRRLVDGLTLSYGTHLYDGLSKAVQISGAAGSRSVLVLSDGRDTSATRMRTAIQQVMSHGVKVDVIALAQSPHDEHLLGALAKAGGGSVLSAVDPRQLGKIFATEAQALSSQVLITAQLPSDARREGTLAVSLKAGSRSFSDSAFVSLGAAPTAAKAEGPHADAKTALQPASGGFQVSRRTMLSGVLALGVGLLVLLVAILGGFGRRPESLQRMIEAYTTRGASARKATTPSKSVTAQAVGVAQKALHGNRGFEVKLGAKLEAGGLSLKPAEWLLLHAGIALGVTALTFLVTGGSVLLVLVALGTGVVGPWLYLGVKQSRRLKAFNSQLAGTLQLLAGSMQAGLSIAQGIDTIVREGAEPVAGEFRRALVETRLGVPTEDALESMAERMMSDDFKWTVMAIRIQREVGGNLAQLLLTVAATLREREYLRRQVKSLSAEGRFSAYLLLAMPPLLLLYEATTNPTYLAPLVQTPMGWVMLAAMGGLMGVGAFMMSRLIKLEV